ncbi:MAG TPA: ATP-dependent DNA helicase [Micromonosporaceae bacterium]|nr:ATP-dependent DNA helicase [Micromonosporaceae bacterium]
MTGSTVVGPRFTPDEIRTRLGIPYRFSDEQMQVISAPADEPLLVVAGAGSGKTELMALRVVWLVANAYVRPDQVLGLTFTRKAAGELAHRIRLYLGRSRQLLGHDAQLAGEPTVATYHSFAARVVREHGMRSGFEPSVRLLTEAACWQLADAAVRQHDSAAMRDFPLGHASATAAVLSLAGELAEHLKEPEDVQRFTLGLTASIEGKSIPRVLRPVQDVLDRQRGRLALLPLVQAYAASKRAQEAMDFADQLRRAAIVAREHPDVAAAERERFRVVLLDEYQDTSEAQLVLLRSLFGDGHPVTAVGDPCQSIYGWRGASVGTLERFPRVFAKSDGSPASIRDLTVSWRNAPQILDVANRVSDVLRAQGLPVKPLRAASTYQSRVTGPLVRCAYTSTYLDEAEFVAGQIESAWQEWEESHGGRPTTAVLVRARSQIPALERALRERGLPVEVVGLGGLLDTPEVRDIVCTLQVLADPTAGASLLRLLTGARWAIGPRDVVALYRRARQLAWQRREPQQDTPGPGAAVVEEPDLGGERLDDAVLAEALDDLGPPENYSAEGYRRLQMFRDELRELRKRLDQSLPDLVADVAQTIGLDVEVAVHSGSTAGLARAHLDAIGDVAAKFAEETEGGTLSAFLAYLAAAEEEERGLTPGEVEVVDGAVQILTVHAAKGLEWDVVAVAGLCKDAFPAKPKGSDHWLKGMGVLPFPLRGDQDGLPRLKLEQASDARGVRDAVEAFEEEWKQHQEREERRLAYVAVTRPRHLLLCSGFRWGEGLTEPREASIFLHEIAEACRAGAGEVIEWVSPVDETNPTLAEEVAAEWPLDPLGERRAAMEEGAAMVREAMAASAREAESPAAEAAAGEAAAAGAAATGAMSTEVAEQAAKWAAEADVLLAERDRLLAASTIDVVLPEHLSVSQLVALRRDPQRLARRLRRPLPEAPDVYARRGTAFHLWLERRFGAAALLDLDDLPGSGDDGAAPDEELEDLQRAFLASEWADRTPYRVEVPFATVIAGVVVRGRMDAVFETGTPGHYDVIDWKTGQRPTGADAHASAVQLAAYRIAWAELAGVPVSQVGAGFHYVRDGVTVRPADLLDHDELVALVAGLPTA